MDTDTISFLDFVRGAIKAEDALSEQYGNVLALRFAPFEVFNLGENAISRVLCMLLDPNGSHGQGRAFLDLFTTRFFDWQFDHRLGRHDFEVTSEHPIQAMRRIDIFIKTKRDFAGPRAFGIENKPWAADQPDQVKDYLESLNSPFTQGPLLYVTKNGDVPPEHSVRSETLGRLRSSRRLRCASYDEITDWLADCKGRCHSERVTWFLGAFRDHLRHFVLDFPMAEPRALLEQLIDTPEYVRAALTVISLRHEIIGKLLKRFSSQLGSMDIGESFAGRLSPDAIDPAKRYFGWRVPLARFEGFSLEFQFEEPDFTDLGWGVGVQNADRMTDDHKAWKEEIYQLLNSSLGQGGKYRDWAWWRRFGENDSHANWRLDGAEWIEVYNGEMAKRFQDKAFQLNAVLASRPVE